jgi:hypothetical protein
MAQHFPSEDMLAPIFLSSPFVPREFAGTFIRGFMRFFQGDFTSATYILMPLLENSLRHVLKTHGHDVRIFDDATQTQKDLTISALFEHPVWRRCPLWVLVDFSALPSAAVSTPRTATRTGSLHFPAQRQLRQVRGVNHLLESRRVGLLPPNTSRDGPSALGSGLNPSGAAGKAALGATRRTAGLAGGRVIH